MSDVIAPLSVGLLGYSDIARRRFIPALAASGCSVLAAIGTRNPDVARKARPDAIICGYDEVIKSDDVDFVYISLPNSLHEEWTCRALAAGKHVICEKPLATSLESVKEMIATARSSDRLLFENLMFVQHPQHGFVKDIISSGRIGTLRTLRSVFGFNLQNPANFRLNSGMGGGSCADLLTYAVGTVELFNLGDLRDPLGFIINKDGLDLEAHGIARIADDATFAFSISFRQHYESYYELIGDAGIARLDRAYTTPPDVANRLLLRSGTGEENIPLPAADQFAETIKLFVRLLSCPADWEHIYSHTLRIHQTIELIKKSLRPSNASDR